MKTKSTWILGLNAWHADASAALLENGEVVAAAEEERFRRVKHWAGFPARAIAWCLEEAGIDATDLDWVAVNRDPKAAWLAKGAYALRKRPNLSFVRDRLRNRERVRSVLDELAESTAVTRSALRARLAHVEHHRAHLASSFHPSPFDRAALVSVDGFGDFASSAWGIGEANRIELRGRTRFPHSLGLFYLAVTQHLGFPNYGDEYKVMGLAAYGKPTFVGELEQVLQLSPGGRFRLGLEYFRHHDQGVAMGWDSGTPHMGEVFSPRLEELLGPARRPDEPLEQRHHDLAASVQARYEAALFHLLRHVHAQTGSSSLCLSGGCAMNGLANGRIVDETPFENLYVPSAPGDAGGAIGAALEVACGRLGSARPSGSHNAYWGPRFGPEQVRAELAGHEAELVAQGYRLRHVPDPRELCRWTAQRIASGAVVGWFQGKMEWGPRALGNRSILADPRRGDMRRLLNEKIKLRELFRPFAPSILRERVGDWFEREGDVPFMLEIWRIRAERRGTIPAVTHVDGTGRLQTVSEQENPLYHGLLEAFEAETGVPMLLNTSFNENEPVVCQPGEALSCFLRTKMDALVLGEWLLERPAA